MKQIDILKSVDSLVDRVQMPGIMFLCGSNTAPDRPYQLRPELWDIDRRGPRHFFKHTVMPHIDGGADRIMLHRMFGEPTRGNAQDFDTYQQMLESGDANARDYTLLMMRETMNFCSQNNLQLNVYLGSFRVSSMQRLLGVFRKWSTRVMSQIYPYLTAAASADQDLYHNIRFIFDHASTYKKWWPEWIMIRHLLNFFGERAAIEAMPQPGYDHQYGVASWLRESLYQFYQFDSPNRDRHFRTPEMLGPVTRYLASIRSYERIWAHNGGLEAFVLDCHNQGHDCFIGDTVLNHLDLKLSQVRDAAQALLSQSDGASS